MVDLEELSAILGGYHAISDETIKYRYMYLYHKKLLVEEKYDSLCEYYKMPDMIEVNGRILNDFLLEELFANSNYKSNINRAVGLFVQYNRTAKYNEQVNELIGLNNQLQHNNLDYHDLFIDSEIKTRKLGFIDKMIIRDNDSYPIYVGYDYVIYVSEYVWQCSIEFLSDDETKFQRRHHKYLRKSAINKIEADYNSIDNFDCMIKTLVKEDK